MTYRGLTLTFVLLAAWSAWGETPSPSTAKHRIVVNIPATELTLYDGDAPLFRYRVAIGQGIYPTPEQLSAIRKIEWNPWWYPPDVEWAEGKEKTPPGPDNPLGLVKMPLSDEILFHGTNESRSVGQPASHGCMRLTNRNATTLAWFLQRHYSDQNDPKLRDEYRRRASTTFTVKLSTPVPVELVYEPIVVRDGKIFLYPDHYRKLFGKYEAALLKQLAGDGIHLEHLDQSKLLQLIKPWGRRTIALEEILLEPLPQLSRAPECS